MTVEAQYSVAAPGGIWDHRSDGTYTVALAGGEVADDQDNWAAADADIGHFAVAVAESATISGSLGDDTFIFELVGDELHVTVNSEPTQVFDAAAVEVLYLDGGAGTDTITLYGSGGADTFTAGPDASRLQLDGSTLVISTGFTTTTVYGSSAASATLYGTSGDDHFQGHEVYDQMFLDSGQTFTLWDFGTVAANVTMDDATYGAASGGGDLAELYDGLDADTFTAGPTSGQLAYQGGNLVSTAGFDSLAAYALYGTNKAILYGSGSDDQFYGHEDVGIMSGPGYYLYAAGFDDVTGDATGAGAEYGGALGGYDVAVLYDAPGADAYYAGPSHSQMVYDRGTGVTSLGFFRMDSYQNADDGSTDVAYLYGSGGDDVLESYEDTSLMSSASYIYYIIGYGEVIADVSGTAGTEYGADSGGVDIAVLYDSAGNDTFYSGPTRGRIEYKSGRANEAEWIRAVAGNGPLRRQRRRPSLRLQR